MDKAAAAAVDKAAAAAAAAADVEGLSWSEREWQVARKAFVCQC